MQLCGTGSLTRQNNIFLANDTGRWKIEIAPPHHKERIYYLPFVFNTSMMLPNIINMIFEYSFARNLHQLIDFWLAKTKEDFFVAKITFLSEFRVKILMQFLNHQEGLSIPLPLDFSSKIVHTRCVQIHTCTTY